MSKKILSLILCLLLVVTWAYVLKQTVDDTSTEKKLKAYIAENEKKQLYKNVVTGYKELIAYEADIKNYKALAESYRNLGDLDAYEEALKRVISLFPEDNEAYCKLMEFYQQKKDHRSAIDIYGSLPESLKDSDRIEKVFEKSRYAYGFLSSAYQSISDMICGNSVVFNGVAYGFINSSGSEVIEPRFQAANIYVNGNTGANVDGKWYIVDSDGDKVSTSDDKFSFIGSLGKNGYAPAVLNGKAGYVDFSLKKYKFDYSYTGSFMEGIAAVKKGEKWALIDEDLNMITDFIYDDIKLEEGFCTKNGYVFAKKDGAYILLDKNGKRIGKESFEDAKLFEKDEPAAVKKENMWGFVDTEGKIKIKYQYEDAYSFHMGLAPVKEGNTYRYINEKGAVKIMTEFNDARPFNENGIAVVKNGELYRLIQMYIYQV